ncbi:hypothetical protein [Caulobacter sp. 17J65-9]|uniref:hypothetical protein n=1 Tax=Caulobacter sp. 17J65-9 TaxID=2709382 RepID=UPI0013C82146|nr:hypothetical protein [Caulobacter sp. 17J65-9]NEX92894.1 hypothetical protein [Caulobacter sp. 17J65-9]
MSERRRIVVVRDRESVRQALEFARTTIIGGALFLLPIFVLWFVLSKILGVVGGFTEPFVEALGVTSIGGIAVGNLVTIVAVFVAAFLAGLFARTEPGQGVLTWIRDGVAQIIPQFSLIQDVARNVGADEDEEAVELPVVLVPTDAGWALGLLLEEEGDWHAVFLPGAPQMSSGSVAYAHTDQIHRTDLTLTHLWGLLRARGKGSQAIYKQLAALQAAGKLEG